MKLLAGALFIVAWTTSCTPSQILTVPEDCNDAKIDKDAEVALDLINKYRKNGYIFALFRVADAHVQHLKNASLVYLTLDVLETNCPVISGKHWSSCGHRPFLSITDLGQCKAVMYINELFETEELYAYNCTVSPVPPKIYECKHCPVRTTVLEDTDKYTEEASKILEEYMLGSNESNYFKVEKVQKVFSAVADRTVFIVEFIIKETKCSRNTHPRNVSKCEFQPDEKANLGFCTGRIVKETKVPDVVVVDSCEICDILVCSVLSHSHHFHHDSGEGHHHCNATGHECKHLLHRHHHHHHHHPYPHYHHHHRHHHHNHSHYHGDIHEHRYPPILGHYQTGPRGPSSNHNSSEQTQEEHRDFPPPPGPRYPPPPPGGPHHLPPSKYPPPPPGPPPPRPIPHRPDDHRRLPNGWVPKCSQWHQYHHHPHRSNDTAYKREESRSSEEQDSFSGYHFFHHSSVNLVHHIPILNEHDVLQAPGANFLDHPFHDQGRHEQRIMQPFPDASSRSKSCPGKPKYDLEPTFLSLFPTPSTQ